MTPTLKHYLISFGAGLLLAVVGILADQFAAHPDGNIDWRLLGFATLGGITMFARDWLKNNSGAFLENVAPKEVQSALIRLGPNIILPASGGPSPHPLARGSARTVRGVGELDPKVIVDFFNGAGVLGLLVFIVVAGSRRVWVWGWYAEELRTRLQRAEEQRDRALGTAERAVNVSERVT